MRALRPLKRSVPSSTAWDLDEQATAERIAADRLVMPVRRPASERWLTLTLMVDSGRSMVVWDPVVDGLRVLLERFGGFRDVRVRYLHTDTPDRVFVHARRPGRNLEHSAAEVIDPTGRQVILVVSDCVGDAWWSGTLGPVLEMWGRQGPVAVLLPLPQQWWTRTAIVPVLTRLHSASPGLANHRIRAEGQADHAGVPVPLLEIESEWLATWAGLVAGTGPGGVPALVAFTGATPPRRPAFAAGTSARERVLRFQSAATPQAFRLAGFLALAPLVLPVMRLVQQAMLPQSRPSHLAEVFLSGLLRAAGNDVGRHELATYDFTGDDVREELIGTVRRSDAARVLTQVSRYLDSRIAADAEFASLIPVRAGTGDRELSSSLGTFGWLPPGALQRLGGGYAAALRDSAANGLTAGSARGHSAALPAEPEVYLAHSSEDAPWLASLVAQLQADGFLVQADSWSAGPADPHLHARRALVSRADIIVVVYGRGIAGLTDAAARCAALVAIAEERSTPVIPLLVEDVAPDPVISSLVWLDGRDRDQAGEALADALRSLRAGQARHEPGPGPAMPEGTSPAISIRDDQRSGPALKTADLSRSGPPAEADADAPGADRETRARPPAQNWAAAVYLSRDSLIPAGSALVVDKRRILTCAHIVGGDSAVAATLWVSFAGSEPGADELRPVREVVSGGDLAMLVLAETTPAGVTAAPLRWPRPLDLPGRACWASGFPDGSGPLGQSAGGAFGEALPEGRTRLRSDGQEYLRPGFCGSGLWSPDYQAAVAVLCSAAQGDSQAITLHQAALSLPGQALRELAAWSAATADEDALAAWGWSLDTDPEGIQHWRPRARGVTADSERGHRFRGRAAALRAIVAWLDRPAADGVVMLVTGLPGAGKSAVLGRIVTTADPAAAGALPADDQAVRATPGSVACAVHAKGKTALEVAIEIARAASASLPEQLDEFAAALRDALAGHGGRFNVLIDALDEAASPQEARAIVASVIRPLAETCADVGAQVVVGTRRRDSGGDLIAACGRTVLIDLDDPAYLDPADLAGYALATLQLSGDERPGTPYADDRVARSLAQRIADLSGGNFLVAGLTARAHGLHDREAADPAQLTFTATVDAAMHAYLRRIPPVAGVAAEAVLTALAFAESPGMPFSVWRAAAVATGAAELTDAHLSQFARSAAASFLTQSGQDGGTPVFRLFHQALNDTLLEARSQIAGPEHDEQAITWSLLRLGRNSGWDQAPSYLLRSLATHASRAGMIDRLLSDTAYLLHADLFRLIPLADGAFTPAGQQRARLLRLTPRAIAAGPLERAALLSVTETIEKLSSNFTDSLSPAPYRARWARFAPRTELAVLEGHSERVATVCALTIRGRALLASGGGDGMVRIWDPETGTSQAALRAHAGTVAAICAITIGGRALLASGGGDGMIRIWDPETGTIRTIEGHQRAVSCLCAVTGGGRALLASGSYDGTLRVWDAATGALRASLDGHDISVDSFATFVSGGRTLLASGGGDGTIRIWDPESGDAYGGLPAYKGPVASVCVLGSDGEILLAGGGIDGAVRVWDPRTGVLRATMRGHTMSVDSMCTVAMKGRTLLASGGGDGTIRIWDPASGADEADRDSDTMVSAVCALPSRGRTTLASGGDDGAIRIWEPASGHPVTTLPSHNSPIHCLCSVTDRRGTMLAAGTGDGLIRIWDPDAAAASRVTLRAHRSSVNCLCTLADRGRTLLVSGGGDRVIRIWDPAAGTSLSALRGHNSSVNCLCALSSRGRILLASGGGRELRIWDPASGARGMLTTDGSPVNCVCALTLGGRTLLVSGMYDGTVQIWDPDTGGHLAALRGHDGLVTSVCVVADRGLTLIASASDDRTVRIWAPGADRAWLTVPIHSPARSIAYVDGRLVVSTAAGLLAIELSERELERP